LLDINLDQCKGVSSQNHELAVYMVVSRSIALIFVAFRPRGCRQDVIALRPHDAPNQAAIRCGGPSASIEETGRKKYALDPS